MLLSIFIAVMSANLYVAAADSQQLRVTFPNGGSVAAGGELTVKLVLDGFDVGVIEQGIYGISFEMNYDRSVLNMLSTALKGSGFENWSEKSFNTNDTLGAEKCAVLLADIEGEYPVTENGALVIEFTFKALANTEGKSSAVTVYDVTVSCGADFIPISLGDSSNTVTVKPLTVNVNGFDCAFNKTNMTVSVSGYKDKAVKGLTVPKEIEYENEKYKVVKIEKSAFSDLSALETLRIPCTVEEVEDCVSENAHVTVLGCENSKAHSYALTIGLEWKTELSDYEETVIKESDCKNHGVKQLCCPDCKNPAGSPEELPLAEHKYGDWVITKEPTDTEEGKRERVCSGCGNKEEEVILKTNCNHSVINEVITKEPTCTQVGIKKSVCEYCGQVIDDNIEVPVTEHSFGAWTVTKQPTYKQDGKRERSCSTCGKAESQKVSALVCSHDKVVETHKDPTCTKQGYDSTTCQTCGKVISHTVIEAQHTPGEPETVDATCTQEGYTVQKCLKCGEELSKSVLPVIEHEFGEWKVAVEPTVNFEGVRTRTCGACGQVENERMPKLDPPESDSSDVEMSDTDAASEGVSDNTSAEESSSSDEGSNKTVFFIIGAVAILLTLGYIIVMAFIKSRNYEEI